MREFSYTNKTILDKETLTDLISDAMETGYYGIGFWGLENGTKNPEDWEKARAKAITEFGEDDCCYCNVFYQALEDGATIIIEDVEEEDGPWELTWEKLEQGCAIFEKEIGNIQKRMKDGDFDSTDAQLIFQYALFGEEVYS